MEKMKLVIKPTSDPDKWDVAFDENPLPIRELKIDFSKRPVQMEASIYLKSCELEVGGQVKLNGYVISDELAYQIYDQLKQKFKDFS